MRAIVWKEVRELALVGVPLLVLACAAGVSLAGTRDRAHALLDVALLGGVSVGIVQGLLDRLRDADLFFLHRPLSRGRRETARTLAGAVTCAALALGFGVAFAIATPREPWEVAWRPGAPTVLKAAGLLIGAWALMRFTLAIRSKAALLAVLVVVPLFALARFTRCVTTEGALAYALALAIVCGGFRFAVRARAVLVLVLVVGVVLEGGFWLRATLSDALFELYPSVGITHAGELHQWQSRRHGIETVHRELDRERREVRRWSGVNLRRTADPPPALFLGTDMHALELAEGPFVQRGSAAAPARRLHFAGGSAAPSRQEHLLHVLNWHEAARRGVDGSIVGVGNDPVLVRVPPAEPPVRWADEDGRIVCRVRDTGREVATLGRVPELREVLARETDPLDLPGSLGLWIARQTGEAFRLAIAGGQHTELEDPGAVEVRFDAVPLPGAPGPARVLDRAFDQDVAVLHRADRLLFVDGSGQVQSTDAWDADETWRPSGRGPHHPLRLRDRVVRWLPLVTEVSPAHPTEVRVRLRLFRVGEPVVRHDVVLDPRTFPERLVAFAGGAGTLLRPPVLNLAAFASAPAPTWAAMNRWWWRTPHMAGGRFAGWLAASLLFGLVCACVARREARMRCATARAVAFWTAAGLALGPLGLAWMALVLGRVPIEPVGGGRRAVDLDATPGSTEPWPEPDRTAIEVVAR